jgi:hypothetical protein
MKLKTMVLAMVVCLIVNSAAHAIDWEKIFCLQWCIPDCPQPKCCDDYCPKPIPCVPPVRCFGCDDYCPKCEPCTKEVCCFVCDDYCYKCPPKIVCPPCCDPKCVPTATCAECCQGDECRGGCSNGCKTGYDTRKKQQIENKT